MGKPKRIAAALLTIGAFMGGSVAAAVADAPGAGDKPQCAGGPSNNNPHCPQNK